MAIYISRISHQTSVLIILTLTFLSTSGSRNSADKRQHCNTLCGEFFNGGNGGSTRNSHGHGQGHTQVSTRDNSPGNCHPWAEWVGACWTGCTKLKENHNGGKECHEVEHYALAEKLGAPRCRCWFWSPLGDPPTGPTSKWVCGRTIVEGAAGEGGGGLDWIIEDCKTYEYGY